MTKLMLLASTINHQQTFAIPIKLIWKKNLELQPSYMKQEKFHFLYLSFFNETDKIFNFELAFSKYEFTQFCDFLFYFQLLPQHLMQLLHTVFVVRTFLFCFINAKRTQS